MFNNRLVEIMLTFTVLFLFLCEISSLCLGFFPAEQYASGQAASEGEAQHAQYAGGIHFLPGDQIARCEQDQAQTGSAEQT